MEILDSHVHFVDPERREGIVWPDPSSELCCRHGVSNLASFHEPHKLSGCIAIETSRRPIDDQWLVGLSEEESLLVGVVLNLQPDLDRFDERLARVATSPVFAGIRFRPIDDYDLSDSYLLENVAALGQLGKTIEFGARSGVQRRYFVDLASRFPEITWILDHCGHPSEGESIDLSWLAFVNDAASIPNAVCKVTSDFSCSDDSVPALECLFDAFGNGRLLYGSNWPVCTLKPAHDTAVARLEKVIGSVDPGFFGENARAVYRLPALAGVDTSQECT
jgi:L-fuconolactonase